ncbi:hypothetical protein [Novosphingobium rosa]|uniref:hypothetical protein n=1 Tax=Novosphingobium rosa TaxID=76978 RepID=UPI0012EDB6EF|nr:hypothetical protein [Novosphingobium rosa]
MLSVTSILITIFWNLHNRGYTNRVAREIRRDSVAFDEWKTQRTELLRCVRLLEACSGRLTVLTIGAHETDPLIEGINNEGRALVEAHSSLLAELDRTDWQNPSNFAYGPSVLGETTWDRLITLLAEATGDFAQAPDIRNHLKGIPPLISQISQGLNEKIKQVTEWHKSFSQ